MFIPTTKTPGGSGFPSSLVLSHSETALGRVHAAVRLILAVLAGHELFTQGPLSRGPLFLSIGLAFGLYSVVLLWLTVRENALSSAKAIHGIDAIWYLLLAIATAGTEPLFSFFLLFPILFASLQWGFVYGFSIAAGTAAVTFWLNADATAGVWSSPSVWLAPVTLVLLGYLIAKWANSVIDMKRYVSLFRDLAGLWTPRAGLGVLVHQIFVRLGRRIPAEGALLITADPGRPRVFRYTGAEDRTTRLPPGSASALVVQLMTLPPAHAAGWDRSGGHWWSRSLQISPTEESAAVASSRACSAIANLLDCESLITAPIYQRGRPTGRIFLTSSSRSFLERDLALLCQVSELISALLENVSLAERLIAEAAENERQKLSRDIHDSAVQPYIGLKFAIEALARKIPPDHPAAEDVRHLLQMTTSELAGLRNMVGGLRAAGSHEGGPVVATVRQQASRFSDLFGIQVEVSAEGEFPDDKKLEGELFHMVSEGLSNVWRHSNARSALIRLRQDKLWLRLEIINAHEGPERPRDFTPASIAERAASLGGEAEVQLSGDGHTTIAVRIPLPT